MNFQDLIKIILVIFLSGLIGYNREKKGMRIGFTIHILVGLSAVILQIASLNFASTNFSGDTLRLGGQMLSGIGFLGAGSIIKDHKGIHGLTTAASIFFVACIGITVGLGDYIISSICTIIGYIFLSDFLKIKKYISKNKNKKLSFLICYDTSSKINIKDILNLLSELELTLDSFDIERDLSTTCIHLKITCSNDISPLDIITPLSFIESITTIKQI